MTASTNSGLPRQRDRSTPSRYDLLLAVIPAAFLIALLANVAFSVPLRTALPAGSIVGAAALADGLFFNPPTEGA
jgi:hypothetical protein